MLVEKHVGITDDTVCSFEDTFLFERACRYNVKGKEHLTTPAKYCSEDMGLRNARTNFGQTDISFGIEKTLSTTSCVPGVIP